MITDVTNIPNTNLPNTTQTGHYVDEYLPPTDSMPSSGAPSVFDSASSSPMSVSDSNQSTAEATQSLEDQNIFVLLGVQDGSDEQKESFLDELQQVIWEDFLENDVQLLLTEQEMVELKAIVDKPAVDEAQKQEDTVVFLEKLIPDLEEIMLEKALELKEDMVRERLLGLREFYSQDNQKLSLLDGVEALMSQNKWHDAAKAMNGLK